MKILVVDDDPEVLDALSEQLGYLGHQVITMRGGFEALSYLESGKHADLILTDVVMPQMDGWELVQTVRARWPMIRIGVVSGQLNGYDPWRESPDLVFTKPVRSQTLEDELSLLGL